ncbi:MAG: NAD(+) synthase [Eubacteriaceae bacterium]|nr:NAD(+) synthase [Eubacteriaceae bacterium]
MDCVKEIENRVAFIKEIVENAHAKGIVLGLSGGKDSALAGILCKMACENTLGLIMPCGTEVNYSQDMTDALALAEKFSIKTKVVDLAPAKNELVKAMEGSFVLDEEATSNMNPRLRMTALYAVARQEGMVVAGTGNACERYVGYFTKWGDGACDFNPIGDMMVSEIYELLEYLGCPENIIKKAPSAGLKIGQTDEYELGVTYKQIQYYLQYGPSALDKGATKLIDSLHERNLHKLEPVPIYSREDKGE